MRLVLARKKKLFSLKKKRHKRENRRLKKKLSKKKVNLKTKETGRCLKQLTGFNDCVFLQKETTKNLSVLLTGNGTSLACAGHLIFEQDLTSFYATGKLN